MVQSSRFYSLDIPNGREKRIIPYGWLGKLTMLIEVFRNVPAGKGCLTLTKTVLDYVCDKQGDFEIRFISFPSEEAEARDIPRAPSILIGGKAYAPGVLSTEELEGLIEEARPRTIGIILTKSPFESEDARMAMSFAKPAMGIGDPVDIFLLGDAVSLAKDNLKGEMGDMMSSFLEGGKVYASGPHLEAGGIDPSGIREEIEVCRKPYDALTDLVMESWDRVVSL
jgi:sulfur relay (sulfurtransferase) DsrF/TusC family protein